MADSSSVSVAENLEYTTTWNSIALQSKARTLPIDIVMACPDYILQDGDECAATFKTKKLPRFASIRKVQSKL